MRATTLCTDVRPRHSTRFRPEAASTGCRSRVVPGRPRQSLPPDTACDKGSDFEEEMSDRREGRKRDAEERKHSCPARPTRGWERAYQHPLHSCGTRFSQTPPSASRDPHALLSDPRMWVGLFVCDGEVGSISIKRGVVGGTNVRATEGGRQVRGRAPPPEEMVGKPGRRPSNRQDC